MNTTAANRLEQLQSDIETRRTSIEEMREQYADMLTAGDDEAADKVAAQIRDDEAKLSILKDRLPVLEEMAAREAQDARAAEAARLTQEANDVKTTIQAHFTKAAKLAAQLNQAVLQLEENSDLTWYLLATKARELGGNPDRTEIEGVREIFGTLESAKARLGGTAHGFSQRATQITLSR
ncbi:hypothetical protein [Halopseudomonas pelagia]|uniref:hypothetical protein n=1 Tax=Halopseudomonas pelagia TaxID=553151 RepID=UPI0003AA3805|nr:hypothetical protein [Halopseudomonas pelagia]